jgi:SAM-dependent methyltransferase
MESSESFLRFHDRAADYARGRPTYPAALVEHLLQRLALGAGAEVADVGSGTGLFTQCLLERGLRVAAVEPSDDMRRLAEGLLGGYRGFSSVKGTARATGLPAASVDAIFCAQAFHWFNERPTLGEWRRILRPGGRAALIWNYQDETNGFVSDYLDVVRASGPDARKTLLASWNAHLDNVLFRRGAAETVTFPHSHELDFDGLLRRTSSTSYLPKQGDPQFAHLAARLREIFDRHQSGGTITFAYRTVAIFGPLEPELN